MNINNQYSIYFNCDNDKGIIKQDVYKDSLYCLGTPLDDSGANSSIIEDSNNVCFKMRCNNKTYVSYDGDGAATSNIAANSFWNTANAEEIIFIIAAASVLYNYQYSVSIKYNSNLSYLN